MKRRGPAAPLPGQRNPFNEWLHAQMNPVAGHLCRQSEIQPGRLSRCDELIRRRKRRFRFAAAHRPLDDVDAWLTYHLHGCGL